MLVADTLTADLYFYANAHVPTGGWAADAARRGVAEGDMTQLRAGAPRAAGRRAGGVLRAARRRRRRAGRVARPRGWRPWRSPRPCWRARASGETVALRVKAVVVALGKVGLPLAARIALAGHEVVGADVDPRVVEMVNDGEAPFPNEAGLPEALARDRRRRAAARGDRHRGGGRRGAGPRRRGPAAGRRRERAPGLGRPRRGRRRHRARAEGRDRRSRSRRRSRSARRARASRRRWRRRPGCSEGVDFHVVFSPERIFSGRAIADLDKYPKLVGGLSAAGEARGIELYASFLDAEVRGPGQRRGGRAEQARRDDLPRHQHRLRQRAGALRRRARHRRAERHRRRQLPALLARPPPGDRGRRPLHPGLPALPAGRRRRRAPAAGRARGQRADARLRRRPRSATWRASAC